MIQIKDKHNCCGCSACVQACPKHCISFDEDEQGFRYPVVDESVCINCGLCEKVCPVINQAVSKSPMKVLAAINPNEGIRMQSSSGGVFTLLAEKIIDESGVVFGARFDDNWEVCHSYTETKEGLSAFRGSKYLQSRIENTYKEAKRFLKQGRKVLYSGTPCQVAGLKKYLKKEYENLLALDIVCHGVPSPLVWREYLKALITRPEGVAGKNTDLTYLKESPDLSGISFRNKHTGWKKYGFALFRKSAIKADQNSDCAPKDIIFYETLDKNLYMQIFLKDLCLRPSCHQCSAKRGKSRSDITLADYWGITSVRPTMDDDRGTSLVLVYTDKGNEYITSLELKSEETTYGEALRGNPSIEHSVARKPAVDKFWKIFANGGFSNIKAIKKLNRISLKLRIYWKVRAIAGKVLRMLKLI